MTVARNMRRDGKGDAVVSAGSTGALLTGATLIVKRIHGIRRAALAPVLPNGDAGVMLIDCGANADCTPEYLLQFAYMGSYYARTMLGIAAPRVGLLSNGTEEHKGSALQHAAVPLLQAADAAGRGRGGGGVGAGRLGYTFRDRGLLENALMHSSYANENRARGYTSNERLEFLGDSVLGMVTATRLYQLYPDMPEGKMSRLRAELVCEQALHGVALTLHLGDYIRLGHGEERSGGRERPSILADAVEAVIAAMYLDGGLEPAQRFILAHILNGLAEGEIHHVEDYKTELQERVQRRAGQTLSYTVCAESGPDHNKTFTMAELLHGREIGRGTGPPKHAPDQTPARTALEQKTQ